MQPVDFTWLFIKMLLALGVAVAAAIFVLRVVVPRMSWAKKLQLNSHFKLLARFGLSQKAQLFLVKIGNKNLVLGAGDGGITKLAELSNEELEK